MHRRRCAIKQSRVPLLKKAGKDAWPSRCTRSTKWTIMRRRAPTQGSADAPLRPKSAVSEVRAPGHVLGPDAQSRRPPSAASSGDAIRHETRRFSLDHASRIIVPRDLGGRKETRARGRRATCDLEDCDIGGGPLRQSRWAHLRTISMAGGALRRADARRSPRRQARLLSRIAFRLHGGCEAHLRLRAATRRRRAGRQALA